MGSRSQWPSGLRRSAADCLLGLRVRIPAGAWIFLLCVLDRNDKRQKLEQSGQRSRDKVQREKKTRRRHGCLSVLSTVCWQVEVSATGRSLVQSSPTAGGCVLVPVGLWHQRGGRGIGGCSMDVEKNTQCKAPDTS